MWFYDEESGDYFFVGALHWRLTVIHQLPKVKGTLPKWFFLFNDNTHKSVLVIATDLFSALDAGEEIIEYREQFGIGLV